MSELVASLINDIISELIKKRENQILGRLKELGFECHNHEEKIALAKRLTLFTFQDRPHYKELYLDKEIFVACWDDTPHFEMDGEKFIAIMG